MFLAVSRNNDLYSRPSRSVTITPWQLQKPATDPETPKGCFCFWGLKLAALKNLKIFVQLILLQTSQSSRAWKHTGGVSFSGCHRVIVADLETQEDDPVNCVNWEMKKNQNVLFKSKIFRSRSQHWAPQLSSTSPNCFFSSYARLWSSRVARKIKK